MELGRASQCVFKICYHMFLCVKYRKWLLCGDCEDFLIEVLEGICERYGFVLDTVGCDGNHIHVFVDSTQSMLLPGLCKF